MKAFNPPCACSVFISLLLLAATQIRAEVFYVNVDAFGFSPGALEVSPGDTVIWYNNDDDDFIHSATSYLPVLNVNYWNVELFGYGDAGGHTFNNPGIFDYRDKYDIGTGTITVKIATPPPVINLVAPRVESGQYLFDATGLTSGKTYELLTSTNLTDWTSISTNVANAASATFTNNVAATLTCYRLLQQP